MSTRLFDKGREALAGASNFVSDTIDAVMVSLSTVDVAVKAITGATNATPIALTVTAHGFANGDIVVVRGVGGNTSANGTYLVAGQTTNAFNLTTLDGLSTVGNGSYTSGGTAVDISLAGALTDIDAGIVGTAATLASKSQTLGVLNAGNPTFSAVTGTVDALLIRDQTTSVPLVFIDGKMLVTVSAVAATSATTIAVEKLAGAIPNGTAIVFSNGVTATLSAGANALDRTLTVTALSAGIAAGHTADVQTTGSGLPFTGSGGSYTFQFDPGANKIIKI